MMSKEAMNLALEALQEVYWSSRSAKHDEAITALREALAEQPARPYRLLQDNGSKYFGESWDKAEQPAQQEPVAFIKGRGWRNGNLEVIPAKMNQTFEIDQPLYTSPPAQRKPLDAGEISRLWKQHTNEDGPHHNPYDDDGLGFTRDIEAAHGIKGNT